MIRVGVFGATGYAGYELLRWLRRHPEARVVFTASESSAGASLADVVPGPLDAPLIAPDEAPLADVDLVFLALPHGAAGKMARRARAGCGSSISPPTFA
jgi:N-acetyl-gamma-glutamyl-phosphate reductase